jgi:hypothetical protein
VHAPKTKRLATAAAAQNLRNIVSSFTRRPWMATAAAGPKNQQRLTML